MIVGLVLILKLLCFEKSQLSWFGHIVPNLPGFWRSSRYHCLRGDLLMKIRKLSGERDIWASLLSLFAVTTPARICEKRMEAINNTSILNCLKCLILIFYVWAITSSFDTQSSSTKLWFDLCGGQACTDKWKCQVVSSSKFQVWLVLQIILFHEIKYKLKDRPGCEYYMIGQNPGSSEKSLFCHIGLLNMLNLLRLRNIYQVFFLFVKMWSLKCMCEEMTWSAFITGTNRWGYWSTNSSACFTSPSKFSLNLSFLV